MEEGSALKTSDVRNLIAGAKIIQGIVSLGESQSVRPELRDGGGAPLTCLQAFDVSQSSPPTGEPVELKIGHRFGFSRAPSEPLDS